jgi:hypothetical protein
MAVLDIAAEDAAAGATVADGSAKGEGWEGGHATVPSAAMAARVARRRHRTPVMASA